LGRIQHPNPQTTEQALQAERPGRESLFKTNCRHSPLAKAARLLLCDDQELIRDHVRAILRELGTFEIIGEAANGLSAVRMALELNPDLLLMDVSMPGLNGIDATRRILARAPGIRVLAYSGNSDEHTIRSMFSAGALGYVKKPSDPAVLITGLMKVLRGERYLSVHLKRLSGSSLPG
jgi:DNA-binding NarL/FixJ family response regulator